MTIQAKKCNTCGTPMLFTALALSRNDYHVGLIQVYQCRNCDKIYVLPEELERTSNLGNE